MKKKQDIEKLIEQYEEAESHFHEAEYQIDKHHDFEGLRKSAHDKMITLGHKIMSAQKEASEQDPNYKKDYFAERQQEETKDLTKDEIVKSDMSWAEKKRLFAERHAEQDKNKTKEKSRDDMERDPFED